MKTGYDFKVTLDGYSLKVTKKLTKDEASKLFYYLFGTDNVGVLDCSHMSDEEFEKLKEELNK